MRTEEFRFRIDSWTPGTLPMKRLAQYMLELSRLLGETDRVHFDKVEPGSAQLVHRIEAPAVALVKARVAAAKTGAAADEAAAATYELRRMLANDNAAASWIQTGRKRPLLAIDGRQFRTDAIDAVNVEQDAIVGEVRRVGGRGDQPKILLRYDEGLYLAVEADKALCAAIAPSLFQTVRVRGRARYRRGVDGSWTIEAFRASGFDLLDDIPLREALDRLKPLAQGWHNADIRDLRKG